LQLKRQSATNFNKTDTLRGHDSRQAQKVRSLIVSIVQAKICTAMIEISATQDTVNLSTTQRKIRVKLNSKFAKKEINSRIKWNKAESENSKGFSK